MLRRLLFAFVVLLLCATVAGAQTKVTNVGQCPKPEMQSVAVPDHPNHSFGISHASKCNYTKPTEIGDAKATEGHSWESNEVTGDTIRYRGVYEETYSNGEKVYYHYEGKGTLKGGAMQSAAETWSVASATGAWKGLKGKGTCKITGNADGSGSFECEGELMPPAAKAPTKAPAKAAKKSAS